MSIRPYLFTAPTRQRVRLRDYVIDLNREKNFRQIVRHFCSVFRKAARAGKPFPKLLLAVHGKAELERIMATNLRRLAIDFEGAATDAIGGRSEHWWDDLMGPGECIDWWEEVLFGDDDEPAGAPEDDDLHGVPLNERDQMREVLDEIDGKN